MSWDDHRMANDFICRLSANACIPYRAAKSAKRVFWHICPARMAFIECRAFRKIFRGRLSAYSALTVFSVLSVFFMSGAPCASGESMEPGGGAPSFFMFTIDPNINMPSADPNERIRRFDWMASQFSNSASASVFLKAGLVARAAGRHPELDVKERLAMLLCRHDMTIDDLNMALHDYLNYDYSLLNEYDAATDGLALKSNTIDLFAYHGLGSPERHESIRRDISKIINGSRAAREAALLLFDYFPIDSGHPFDGMAPDIYLSAMAEARKEAASFFQQMAQHANNMNMDDLKKATLSFWDSHPIASGALDAHYPQLPNQHAGELFAPGIKKDRISIPIPDQGRSMADAIRLIIERERRHNGFVISNFGHELDLLDEIAGARSMGDIEINEHLSALNERISHEDARMREYFNDIYRIYKEKLMSADDLSESDAEALIARSRESLKNDFLFYENVIWLLSNFSGNQAIDILQRYTAKRILSHLGFAHISANSLFAKGL